MRLAPRLGFDRRVHLNDRFAVAAGDLVQVSRSLYPARMLVPPDRNPFDVLRQKLHWGAR